MKQYLIIFICLLFVSAFIPNGSGLVFLLFLTSPMTILFLIFSKAIVKDYSLVDLTGFQKWIIAVSAFLTPFIVLPIVYIVCPRKMKGL